MSNNPLDSLAQQLVDEAEEQVASASSSKESSKDAKKATSAKDSEQDRNLKMILDIPLKVTVELGRTKMPVSELLNLTQGSVIELNKLAGEPMEVLVNEKLIARGEAVVVNEKFGVRLTDIISQSERVEQLR